ncbi:MAG: VOC family protein [Chloroflexota bacterium]
MPQGTKNQVIANCGMHHVAVQAKDWDESLKLYQDVLGMEIIAEFGAPDREIILLDMGDGSHIELFQPTADTPLAGTPPPDNQPFFHVALATSDTKGATEHVRSAGYKVTVEPKTVQLGQLTVTISFFEGPAGEILEFFQVHDE